MTEPGKEEGKKKGQRGRNIIVGVIVALVFIFSGAWLAREFIIPKAPSPTGQEMADTGLIDWQQVLQAHPD